MLYSHIQLYIYITTICGNIVNIIYELQWMNKYPLTLYSKGLMLVVCERWVRPGTDCHILTKVLLATIAGTSSSSWLGCSTVCHLQELVLTLWHPISNCDWNWTDPTCLWRPSYIIVWCLPASCGHTHLHRIQPHPLVRWYSDIFDRCTCFAVTRLVEGDMLQSSHTYFSKFHMWNFFSGPSPSPSHTHFTYNAQGQQQWNCKKKLLEQQQKHKQK